MFFPPNDSCQNDTKNIDFILFQMKLSKAFNKKVRFLIKNHHFSCSWFSLFLNSSKSN